MEKREFWSLGRTKISEKTENRLEKERFEVQIEFRNGFVRLNELLIVL
jgi:hypothetical protein